VVPLANPRGGDALPDQDALEVAPQARLAAQSHDRERGTADLVGGIRAREGQAAAAVRLGQRCRHDQSEQHHRDQHQPYAGAVGREPVGDPGGVHPGPPQRQQQQQRLYRTGDAQVPQQQLGQLRHREHVDQIEEQLHVRDPSGVLRPPQKTRVLAELRHLSLPPTASNSSLVARV